jgi:hypothetical protein
MEDDMKHPKAWHAAALLLVTPVLALCDDVTTLPQLDAQAEVATAARGPAPTVAVSGNAVHFMTTAIVHSQEPTDVGMIQRSTEIIELTGDLAGFVLYHPVSIFDFTRGTLVNTGTQIFSGTILGSEPMILHDDTFQFDVDLATGETLGRVRFQRSRDAPHPGAWYECELTVVGAGTTGAGDILADYSGECTRRGSAR